jgi:N-acetylmuramoyl-L-alanine amidase
MSFHCSITESIGTRQDCELESRWSSTLSLFRHRALPDKLKLELQRLFAAVPLLLGPFLLAGCATIRPGTMAPRTGDEIVVAGRFVHTGTRVVLWMDPGGYDAYRVERRFAPFDQSSWETSHVAVAQLKTPNRYGLRQQVLTPAQIERVRGGGWDLPLLQEVVDQFVIHFDASGTSRQCFKVLHDVRDLSVHFMLDLDGTIYQTLDAKERAWHATSSNTRSVGIEIANPGAFPAEKAGPLDEWYARDTDGRTRITIPARLGDGGIRTPNFIGRPARPDLIRDEIQGQQLAQYDFTPDQYRALIHLTAALCKVLPRIRCDYPRDAVGRLRRSKLPDDDLNDYEGVLGHFHVQTNKVDPGPAFQWDLVIDGARELLHLPARQNSKGGAEFLQSRQP